MSLRAWSELIALSIIWGGSFLAIRTALDEIPVMSVVAHRVGWAAFALWIVILVRGVALPKDRATIFALLGMGVLNNAIPFSLLAWGQLEVETGLTSILNGTTAIFGVLLAAAIFADERLTWNRGLGVCLGFVGVALAIGPAQLLNFDLRSAAQGAILLAALSYAVAGMWAKKHLAGLDPMVAAAGMLTSSALILVPLAAFMDGATGVPREPATIAAILYYALISTAFAYLLYYRVLAMAGSGNVLLCTLLIPPVAIVLGALVRGEVLTPGTFFGFAALASGLMLIDGRVLRRGPRRRNSSA
ncbi:MAG: DMT family transporter [Pseudomonadota bacterium]